MSALAGIEELAKHGARCLCGVLFDHSGKWQSLQHGIYRHRQCQRVDLLAPRLLLFPSPRVELRMVAVHPAIVRALGVVVVGVVVELEVLVQRVR